MSNTKEIRKQIKSVKSTQKITKAMEMVAASKMRRAQDRMQLTRPYTEQISKVIAHIAGSDREYQHPYLVERNLNTVGFIVVSTDRGLCGGLNLNLFKAAIQAMTALEAQQKAIALCMFGSKGQQYFKNAKLDLLAHANHYGDAPTLQHIIGPVKVMLDAYSAAKIDRLMLCFNKFVNTMTQQPMIVQLLPLISAEELHNNKNTWDYIYEPDAKTLLNLLLNRYLESQVYQAVVENLACEQAARMVAMKSASDNAASVIDDLQLIYNKARQAAITQELAEIVAGAGAV